MDDKINIATKHIGDLFDDLWGKSSEILRRPSEEDRPQNASDTPPVSDSAGTEDILSLLTDLEKNLRSDRSFFSSPSSKNVGKSDESKTDDTGKNISSHEAQEQADNTAPADEPQSDPMEDLNALVGMTDLKKDVTELISLVKMQKMRKEQGLKSVPVSLHLVFSGNPGTGKTTVARILARLYKNIGVLSKGQLIEVDRSSLVAGYVGQTATKTQEKINEAMGGVLFIDEAYTLAKEGGNDFGQEAIDTLLKAMEDHRDNFVVIVAGYPDLMERFINSNPGLKSRFNKYLLFPDYSEDELYSIFCGFCEKYEYQLDQNAVEKAKILIHDLIDKKEDNFANAREVRNLFEKIITRQASRIGKLEEPVEKDEITRIIQDDLDIS